MHNNPVNNIDPTGQFSIMNVSVSMSISSMMRGIRTFGYIRAAKLAVKVGVGAAVLHKIKVAMAASPRLDTVSAGGGLTAGFSNIGSVPMPIGATGGVEGAFGVHSGKAAWFGFLGATTYNAWSGGAYFGVSFNTPDSFNYRWNCL